MISDGDSLSLDIIYNKYINLIYKKIREFNFKDDYEDILQECLIVLNNSIEKYKDGPVPFAAFFMRNLQNKLSTIYTMKKKKKVIVSDLLVEMMDPSFSFEEYPELTKAMFEGLTPFQIKIIDYRFIKRFDVPYILKTLNIKRSTFYYELKKGIDRIKYNVEKHKIEI
ncbi:sigma-70 family RNA polymerase sigma factor [bacterium]|nr:sigma-70 family RNA polymerase sigma factor [bacterium]